MVGVFLLLLRATRCISTFCRSSGYVDFIVKSLEHRIFFRYTVSHTLTSVCLIQTLFFEMSSYILHYYYLLNFAFSTFTFRCQIARVFAENLSHRIVS